MTAQLDPLKLAPCASDKLLSMSGRFQSGLVLLLMVLVFAASSQAAVCELACGLGAQSLICHAPGASAKEDASSPAMTSMSHGHCVPAMHGDGVREKSATHTMTASLTGSQDRQCHHDVSLAVEGTASTTVAAPTIHWAVIEMLPVAVMPPGTWFIVQSSPPPHTAADSLLVTLRI